MRLRNIFEWVGFVVLLAWMAALLTQKIDLTTADIGRHIVNGRMILGPAADRAGVLYTNFYSYTMGTAPFVNHHWLTGVVFYLIWRSAGFEGLTVWNILLGLIAFGLIFDVARRASNFWMTAVIAAVAVPLITTRFDVRPEMITNCLTGMFVWICWRYRAGELGFGWLCGLPVLMLLWVNFHIGFVFGFMAVGAFLLDAWFPILWARLRPAKETSVEGARQKKRTTGGMAPSPVRSEAARIHARRLMGISGVCVLAGLANPHFIRGLLYPLSILDRYGYRILENQSMAFLERLGLAANQHFTLFEIFAGTLAIACLLAAVSDFRKLDVALLLPAFVAGLMSFFAIRHFVSFALLAVPAIASALQASRGRAAGKGLGLPDAVLIPIAVLAVVLTMVQQYGVVPIYRPSAGLGVLPGVDASGDFFNQNHIAGPIFNDYDVGGYLIYKLNLTDPTPKVFVDNRPEAYTPEFFQNVYIPAQRDEGQWHQLDQRYHFNTIFFSHRDSTPWAKSFLANRAKDSAWAPVFADAYNIIFVRRENPANDEVIRKYAMEVRLAN